MVCTTPHLRRFLRSFTVWTSTDFCILPANSCSKDGIVASEYTSIFESLRKCLELRDKYMRVSGQMLGFNPKDHDGQFSGLDSRVADVSGVRPDVDLASGQEPASPFQPWRIYPRPPPPHWHWVERGAVRHTPTEFEDEEFIFENCEIPGPDPNHWNFELDERGVYQVYDSSQGKFMTALCECCNSAAFLLATTEEKEKRPVFDIPTIREYYLDLEYVLDVIADGPTKSFAFRRLAYLSSKFTMYQLLNEFQELADMKVCHYHRLSS